MWQPGQLVLWRGIFRGQVWQAQTVIVVRDTPEETAVALLPGTECMDEVEYQTAIDHGVIFPEWVQGVEAAKTEILARLERRAHPFDGSWLDWRPDPTWSPPSLPANWDKI